MTYVEALPEPTPKELQEKAQEEARVFASLGKSFFSLPRLPPIELGLANLRGREYRSRRSVIADPQGYRSRPRR